MIGHASLFCKYPGDGERPGFGDSMPTSRASWANTPGFHAKGRGAIEPPPERSSSHPRKVSAGLSPATRDGARAGNRALEQRAIHLVLVKAIGERGRRHVRVGAEDPHEIGSERDLARGRLLLPVPSGQIKQRGLLARAPRGLS